MKYILFLLILVGCGNNETYDYMFTVEGEGTYVCDSFGFRGYQDCEHVMSGRQVDSMVLGKNVTVPRVNENTK